MNKDKHNEFLGSFRTVFLKDVFQNDFKIISITPVGNGVSEIKAERIVPSNYEFNTYSELFSNMYINKLSLSQKGMSMDEFVLTLK